MSFASLTFLIFLALVFALHWVGRARAWQNAVLFSASVVFYGWWDWRFCGLMLGSALVDYAIGRGMAGAATARRKALLVGSLVFNLGLLAIFKYLGFFVDTAAVFLAGLGFEANLPTLRIVLPVGISFYTFQTLSYTIDIYRGRFEPQRDLLAYLTFVCFFPQLVAGPIERASHLLPQFLRPRRFDPAEATTGCQFIVWGLVKKMVLADNLGEIVNTAYAAPVGTPPALLALGTVCFAFQIYCDFSGYSDIAIGAARLFGIRLMRNFNYPYFARSVTEFWRRWHISMSTWFRDYVFIPLGGSRGDARATTRNLLLTTCLSGLWHGAAWHFVAWGLLQGICLAAERVLGLRTSVDQPADGGPTARAAEGMEPASPSGFSRATDSGAAQLRPPEVLTSEQGPAKSGERVFLPAASSRAGNAWRFGPRCIDAARMLGTFTLVTAAWVLFRAESISEATQIYARIGGAMFAKEFYSDLASALHQHGWLLAGVAALVVLEWLGRDRWLPPRFERLPAVPRWTVYTALVWLALLFGTRRVAEFIYFQF